MGVRERKISHYVKPMLAIAVDKPFSDGDWLYELKLDGYRAVAETGKRKLLLYSRNGLSLTQRFPSIAEALRKIKTEAILDGEIVLLNEKGRPDFQKLQNYGQNMQYQLVYYVFDLLSLKQKDLKHLSLTERKKQLQKILKKTGPVRFLSHIEDNGIDFFRTVKLEDMEGIIAKKKGSIYIPGTRTRDWLKIKNHKSQEVIIIGYTAPRGARQHFGSILLAQYKDGILKYVGHAGTGFAEKTLHDLFLQMNKLAIKKSPLEVPVKANNKVTWLRPKLVCEISYSEITNDGIFRHPVFKGLRTEKKAENIEQETESEVPIAKVVKSKTQRT
jgi:bifunctional non-homologous end joining protein LigD